MPFVQQQRLVVLAACFAALVPLGVFMRQILRGEYAPGSSYRPRLEAVVKASHTGAHGGPFASDRKGEGFTLAPGLLNDLGMAALSDLWGRATGAPLRETHLALFNLVVMAAALLGLVLVMPAGARPALVVLFLSVPVAVYEYRSPDSVAIHGALAAIAVGIAVAPQRRWPVWTGAPLGIALFLVHNIRSPFGAFGVGALLLAAAVAHVRTRDRRALRTIAVLAATFALLEVPWRVALERRASDPRVVDEDVLRAHNVYNPLVSGLGWSENRWGIKPWDPWVATFLAERTGLPPVVLETFESERRARIVYLSLWREAPGHLVAVYLSRVPGALQQHAWLGLWGTGLWLALAAVAGAAAWRRRDALSLATVIAPAVVSAGLVAQIVLIDPRLLYSYPLRFTSALGLLTALALVVSQRAGRAMADDGPATR
jgi:hypothetical protein